MHQRMIEIAWRLGKRQSLLLLLFSVGSSVCSALPVDELSARQSASQFLNQLYQHGRRASKVETGQLRLAYTAEMDSRPLFYVFNTSDDEGFVLAAADDCAAPVLGYSDNGSFDYGRIPDGLKGLLKSYEKQITCAVASGAGEYRQATPKDDRLDVGPLILTHWDQRAPYNALCPLYQGNSTLTGCVATATAQLMYYHQWPKQGRGHLAYVWKGKKLSVDFSQAHFEYEKMRLEYRANTPDEDQAVATLMYYNALAAEADFGINITYGYFDTQKLHLYFGYKDQMGWLDMDYSTPEAFDEVLFDNLERGLPVLYRAEDPSVWAHVFLVDGYRVDGYYHMNLGWGGYADGYYLLNVVNTPSANLRTGQMMVYNIEPEDEQDGVVTQYFQSDAVSDGVFTMLGQHCGHADALDRLPSGIYIIGGRKVMKR